MEEKVKSLKPVSREKGLLLTHTDTPDLKVGTRKDGKKYSVRTNRLRFFFPKEWMKFYDQLVESQKLTFDCLINTGARINETRHIKIGDIALEEKRIILRVTKIKAKKGETNPRPRTISISSQFTKRLKELIKGNNNEEYIKILSTPAANIAMKKALRKAEIKDYYMFSIHNIRKTHGNWLKALGIDGAEICTRLGHDYNTFLKDYSSPDIFSWEERGKMRMILGDLYERK